MRKVYWVPTMRAAAHTVVTRMTVPTVEKSPDQHAAERGAHEAPGRVGLAGLVAEEELGQHRAAQRQQDEGHHLRPAPPLPVAHEDDQAA